jgi:hypothetical protein
MTATTGYHCLRGVLVRPLNNSLTLTDSQASYTLLNGADVRGQAGNDTFRWEVCAIVSSTHKWTGSCGADTTGNVRVVYELGSRHVGGGVWSPVLSQVWLGRICALPDYWSIDVGGTCPPPNPSGLGDFNVRTDIVATSWAAGPPFTATFSFPAATVNLGSTTEFHWNPMPGTITLSE